MIELEKKSSWALLAVTVVLSAGVLSGCFLDRTSVPLAEESLPIEEKAINAPSVEKTIPPEIMTETDLEAEINDLDLEISNLETTGFEADNLSDKDLGL